MRLPLDARRGPSMVRRGVPRPSTVVGTIRALSRGPASQIPSELDRLLAYWPAFHAQILAQASDLPHPHFLEVLLWLLSQPAVEVPGSVAPSPAATELDSGSDAAVVCDGYEVVEA